MFFFKKFRFLVLSGSLITFPVVSSKAVKNTSDVHPSSPNGLTQQLSPGQLQLTVSSVLTQGLLFLYTFLKSF